MTIRKLTSIILAMVMLVSISVITVSAAYDDEIAENETIQVPASFEKATTVKFVAAESKTLCLKSGNHEEYAFCDLYDDNGELLAYSYDNLYDMSFSLVYDFEAGKTYYFAIRSYSDEEIVIDITLGCAHSYTDGVCDICGAVCDHSVADVSLVKVCECGSVYYGNDIACGDTFTVVSDDENYYSVFRFIPEETGNYIFRSYSADADPMAYIIYSSYFLNGNDDFGYSFDFLVFEELTAGETYYFITEELNSETYDVSLTKAVHTADDGSEHDVEYHGWYYGTCQEISYTEGIYCPECDEYIEGHLEDGYGFHDDYDIDGHCDYCGEVLAEDSIMELFFQLLDDILAALQEIFDLVTLILETVGVW